MAEPYSPAAQSIQKAANTPKTEDFFKLIAAQLVNQSMFDTVDNTQLVTQMAQLSTLSQISDLCAAVKSGTAVSLIGKTVSVATKSPGGQQAVAVGQVEQISMEDGTPYLYVGGSFYPLEDVLDIGA